MNRWFKALGLLVAAGSLIMGSWGNASAEGWQEIWKNLSDGKTIQSGVLESATFYGAQTQFVIYDGDGISDNFSDADSINVVLRSSDTNDMLTFNGTKTQLVDWAKTNSDVLLKIIFPCSPETSISGVTGGQFTAQQMMVASFGTLSTVRNVDIHVSGQYDYFELGPEKTKATGSSGLFAYSRDFGQGNQSLGIMIPYRYLKSEDTLNSKMGYFSLVPVYKHRYDVKDSQLEWVIDMSIGAVYLKSGLFPKGGGYIEYGGGTGLSYLTELVENLNSKVGISYQVLKKSIPDSLVTDELKWVSEAMNNLNMEQDLTLSAGLTYDLIPKAWDVSTNVFRIHQLQSDADPDCKYQTVWSINTGYTYKFFHVQLGYKTSFEMKDYKDNSYICTVRYNW
jgi:hypothetical protein